MPDCPGRLTHEPEGTETVCTEVGPLPEGYESWPDCCAACHEDGEWWVELLAQVEREGG